MQIFCWYGPAAHITKTENMLKCPREINRQPRPAVNGRASKQRPDGLKSTVYGALLFYSTVIYRGADQAKHMSNLIM